MRKSLLLGAIVSGAALISFADAAVPRGGGGGGRGGGGGGGAMPHRPAAAPQRPSPQIQRPAPQIQRPAPQIQRPPVPAARPNPAPIARPSAPLARPAAPAQRPQMPPQLQGRPGGGAPNIGNRPSTLPGNINRPNLPGGGNIPQPPALGGNRPSTLPGNINRPNLPGGGNIPQPPVLGGNRPSTLPGNINRPNLPGGGNFPQPPALGGNRPTPLPGPINRPGGNGPGIGIGGNRPGGGFSGGVAGGAIGSGGGQFPNRPGNLPGPGDRPGIGNRPGIGDRPGLGDRPGIGDRPNIGSGNNNNIGDRWNNVNWNNRGGNTVIGGGNNITNINNRNINNSINRNINVNNRPAWGGNWNGGYRPPYYGGWYHGGWNWNGPGWWGAPGAFATGWMLGNVTSGFSNPYYIAPAVGVVDVYNYAEPVPIYVDAPVVVQQDPPVVIQPVDAPFASPVLPTDVPPPVIVNGSPNDQPEDPKVKEAGVFFDAAREQFKNGNYADAVAAVDKAIKVLPNDTALHEFRSLALFAQRKYTDAAAVIYSVLAVGPGWNYETIKTFYADWHTYETQLKDLKAFVDANPKDAASRFLLAYHFLVLDERQAAVTMLNQVAQLNPNDQLAPVMARAIQQSLTPPPNDRPTIAP